MSFDQQSAAPVLYAPSASATLGASVAAALGVALAAHEEHEYSGGEHKMRALQSVRGRSIYVLQSLFGDGAGSPNDRLCRLLFFIGGLKDAGARRVTACVPFLAYARKDRRVQARDPVTTRYVAQLFEAVGTDAVMVLDVHNIAAFDNAFRCESIHLEAAASFIERFVHHPDNTPRVVVSPDIGGIKRARHFQERLELALGRPVEAGFMDKKRNDEVVSGDTLVGNVSGKAVILVDDLISSGTTLLRAVDACRRAGAARVDVAATHATFAPEAHRLFGPTGPESVMVTDSVNLGDDFRRHLKRTLQVVPIGGLFAEAIRRSEHGGSLSELGGM